jgi:hypothetical protein
LAGRGGERTVPGWLSDDAVASITTFAGLVFDHFGDFEGFVLEDLHGGEHRFDSHEKEVRELVQRAWADRVMTTVLTNHDHSHRPVSIILRGV